jgi:hypothetical protein
MRVENLSEYYKNIQVFNNEIFKIKFINYSTDTCFEGVHALGGLQV